MESEELNKLLIETFPNLNLQYQEEISWQEGDNTGSHTIYGDIFTPYIEHCIKKGKDAEINNIFEFIEFLLSKNDRYASEVVAFSVIESIEYLLQEQRGLLTKLGRRTTALVNEIASK